MVNTIDINAIENLFKRYLLSPVHKWDQQRPVITTSSELDSLGLHNYGVDCYLEVDIEDVGFDTINTFNDSHIISKNYRLFLRIKQEIPLNEEYNTLDFKFKQLTDNICRILSSDKEMIVAEEVVYDINLDSNPEDRFTTAVNNEHDISLPTINKLIAETDKPEPTPSYFTYPFYTYSFSGSKIDNGAIRKLLGYKIKNNADQLEYVYVNVERGTDNSKEAIRVLEIGPPTVLTTLDVKNNFIYQIIDIKPANLRFSLNNVFYTFIDNDDVGRELRNEIILNIIVI